jgi:hypothetical protein
MIDYGRSLATKLTLCYDTNYVIYTAIKMVTQTICCTLKYFLFQCKGQEEYNRLRKVSYNETDIFLLFRLCNVFYH